MKLIDDIRRDNLAALAKEFGGVAGLSRKLERSESQISQWIRGAAHSKTGKQRGMRAITARWVEQITEKPTGWLDINHEDSPAALKAEERSPATYITSPHHSRPLVQQVCDLAEKINDEGLRELSAFASYLTCTQPLAKAKRA